jgi:hypothetical protein
MEIDLYLKEEVNNLRSLNRSGGLKDIQPKNNSEIEKSKKRGNFILRQELNNYTIDCTMNCSIIFHVILFLVFFGFGIPIILSAGSIEEEIQYDDW